MVFVDMNDSLSLKKYITIYIYRFTPFHYQIFIAVYIATSFNTNPRHCKASRLENCIWPMEIRRPCPLSGIPGKGTSTCHDKNCSMFFGASSWLIWLGRFWDFCNFLFNWKDSSSFQFFDLKSTDILASLATSLEALQKFAPEKLPNPNRKVISQPSFFRGYVKLWGKILVVSLEKTVVRCGSTPQLQACVASKPSRRSWRLSGAWKDQTGKHHVALQCLHLWLIFKLHHISIYFAYSDWNKMSDNIKHLE